MTRKTADTILHDLHNTYLLMKMSGIAFTYENLAQYSDADTTGQVPHPDVVESHFGTLSKALRKINVEIPSSIRTKRSDEELKRYFFRAYRELKRRGITFNRNAYSNLASEKEYSYLPKYENYLQRYGSLEGILKHFSLYMQVKDDELDRLQTGFNSAISEAFNRGLFFNLKVYKLLTQEKEFSHLPSYKVLWSRYGTWEEAIKQIGVHDQVVKSNRELLKKHLLIAYNEITKRQMPFNRESYQKLRKDTSYHFLPTINTYQKGFIDWQDAVASCGLEETFNYKSKSSGVREKILTVEVNGELKDAKQCRACKTIKKLEDMAPNTNQPSGKDSICAECKAARAKTYYESYKQI